MCSQMEILPAALLDRWAIKAGRQAVSESTEPENVEVLKRKPKSSVYRLSGVAANGTSVIAKRCRRASAIVERLIYEDFLARLPVPALRLLEFLEEPDGRYCWLILEDAGDGKYMPVSAEHRTLAGDWLGNIHAAAIEAGLEERLPDREPDHYLRRLRSSRRLIVEQMNDPALTDADGRMLNALVSNCAALESHWTELEERCAGAPRTIVHGDLVTKNVRVRSTAQGLALLVFDWENAGWGPPCTDLAQFTGPTVSPDLTAYCSILEQRGRQLDPRMVRRLAECGTFFRVVDDIDWACLWIIGNPDWRRHLVKPISLLRHYNLLLAAALRAIPASSEV